MTSKILLVFGFLTLTSTPLFAHHSSAPHFDDSRSVDVTGSFVKLRFVNPHAYIYFDVEENGETEAWRCELIGATQLKRRGWSANMFSKGEKLIIHGAPARREANVCYLKTITREDGTDIARYADISGVTGNKVSSAKNPAAKSARATHLKNGQANLSGPWITLSFGRGSVEGIRPRYAATTAGKDAAQGYQMEYDDPILQCHYVNLINGWNHDRHVNDIVQKGDKIILQYGFMDVDRVVHLGMKKHPENLTPSPVGHSIGHWDGDILVVDTIGFEEGVLNHRTGIKHSREMRVIEKFRVDTESKRLYRDYTLIDPLYLVGETKGQDVMTLSGDPHTSYNCVELSGDNNKRPTSPM